MLHLLEKVSQLKMRTMKKKGAMEMSVGTIVTIVLLMAVLVLGIFLVQRIFGSATNAIDEIDSEVQSEIRKLFADEGGNFAIYPTSRQITIKRDRDPRGFAFSVKNDDNENRDFTYTIVVSSSDFASCGSSFTAEQANSWLITNSGSFSLGPSAELTLPELVLFEIPKSVPECTISYRVEVEREGHTYESASVYVTIK